MVHLLTLGTRCTYWRSAHGTSTEARHMVHLLKLSTWYIYWSSAHGTSTDALHMVHLLKLGTWYIYWSSAHGTSTDARHMVHLLTLGTWCIYWRSAHGTSTDARHSIEWNSAQKSTIKLSFKTTIMNRVCIYLASGIFLNQIIFIFDWFEVYRPYLQQHIFNRQENLYCNVKKKISRKVLN